MRQVLDSNQVHEKALKTMKDYHSTVVDEVKSAIKNNKVVVVGMAQNPVVKKARKLLTEKGIEFKYLEYGSYLSMWRPRLAIKLWSGWPTFPQVFVDGRLIGGCSELTEYLNNQKN
jgi:monothiol glutaredoxin